MGYSCKYILPKELQNPLLYLSLAVSRQFVNKLLYILHSKSFQLRENSSELHIRCSCTFNVDFNT